MITRVLAHTDNCRDGNCPTAYLTDRGTVVLQGDEVLERMEAVEVPEQIILDAARDLAAAGQRYAGWPRGAVPATFTSRGTVVVVGDRETVDAAGKIVPVGERAIEVAAAVVFEAASWLRGAACAA